MPALRQLTEFRQTFNGIQQNIVKAIGGVWVKKVMVSLFERTHRGEKDAFYRMKISFRVQKLSQFEDRKFRCISYKKDGKNQFF